jgi:hypothetical protein
MNGNHQQEDLRQRRSQAVRTAWILGLIAFAIFATFIGSAILGR